MRFSCKIRFVLLAALLALPMVAGAQFQPDRPAEIDGWCCRHGKVFPAPEPECFEVDGRFFVAIEEAKAACVGEPPLEEGWCCRGGKVFPFARAECIQLGGRFFPTPEQAERECRPEHPHGWCCLHGRVFEAPEPECMELGGQFFDEPHIAEQACGRQKDMLGDPGFCCLDNGEITAAPGPTCIEELGGRLFGSLEDAERACHPMPEPCACIYFEYLPKVSADTAAWAGISFTNVGELPVTSVVGHLFESNGAHWLIELPPLDVMNKRTLLYHDDRGVKISDLDTNAVYQPVPLGPPAKLGALRSSLYIVACGEAPDARYDLDGIVLLGQGGDTNSSYLARKPEAAFCPRMPEKPQR
jgi:hypothetical protein